MRAVALVLCCVLAVAASAAVVAAAPAHEGPEAVLEDIRGPIGPVPYPQQRKQARTAVAAASVLALLAAVCLFMHMRHNPPESESPETPSPAAHDLPSLDAAASSRDFYGALLTHVRRALAARSGPAALAMTPRELSRAAPIRNPESQRAWSGLCARAEAALYAGQDIAREDQAADLQAARQFLEAMNRGT